MVAAAVVGSAVVGGVASSAAAKKQASAADSASAAQSASAQAGIDEQARQFDSVRSLLNPYVQAGTGNFNAQAYLNANPDVALNPYYAQHPEEHFQQYGRFENRQGANTGSLFAQQSLLGLNGDAARQSGIDAIKNSAGFQSLLSQGENSIRQNASATGGLRGGNTQGALAQFSPALLAQQIQQQYSNLSGITSLSQNAAAGVGNAGQNAANNISNLYQQQGAAQAGSALAAGNAQAQTIGGYAQGLGTIAGGFGSNFAGFGGFGGSATTGIATSQPTFGAGTSGFGSQFANTNIF